MMTILPEELWQKITGNDAMKARDGEPIPVMDVTEVQADKRGEALGRANRYLRPASKKYWLK